MVWWGHLKIGYKIVGKDSYTWDWIEDVKTKDNTQSKSLQNAQIDIFNNSRFTKVAISPNGQTISILSMINNSIGEELSQVQIIICRGDSTHTIWEVYTICSPNKLGTWSNNAAEGYEGSIFFSPKSPPTPTPPPTPPPCTILNCLPKFCGPKGQTCTQCESNYCLNKAPGAVGQGFWCVEKGLACGREEDGTMYWDAYCKNPSGENPCTPCTTLGGGKMQRVPRHQQRAYLHEVQGRELPRSGARRCVVRRKRTQLQLGVLQPAGLQDGRRRLHAVRRRQEVQDLHGRHLVRDVQGAGRVQRPGGGMRHERR